MADNILGFSRATALRPEVGEKSRRDLTAREKAAVIVRLLLAKGSSLPINTLPEHMQSALAEQMSQMRLVNRSTLDRVVAEFLEQLEQEHKVKPDIKWARSIGF